MKRAFHIVYTILALNFFLPSLAYIFAPDFAVGQFAGIGAMFGAGPYPHTEDSMLWKVLGIANVMTLAFVCVLLQLDLRKWLPCLAPLLFLKGMAAMGFLVAFVVEPYPSYLAGFLLDAVTCAAMWYFATAAHKELEASPVPAKT
ncbi:MAG: hypothetical protein EXR79_16425 [Myxococcales bacterium]|nr:hypothetical protein [Myxococcales bacterium]